jgi:hypothetical protein
LQTTLADGSCLYATTHSNPLDSFPAQSLQSYRRLIAKPGDNCVQYVLQVLIGYLVKYELDIVVDRNCAELLPGDNRFKVKTPPIGRQNDRVIAIGGTLLHDYLGSMLGA